MGIAGAGTDTRDMLAVHAAFRREFRLAPGLVSTVAGGDVTRARIVAEHLRLLLDLLHVHHGGEDRLLWPRLRQRVPADRVEILESVARQHQHIDATIQALEEPLPRWVATATTADRDAIAADLATLHLALDEHLQAEERMILPLAARYVTQPEWDELAGEVKTIPARKLPIAFGMLMYEADPDVVAVVLAAVPALPRMLMPHLAPPIYARYARRVFGTATP